jgi:hypothetical protein
MGPELSTVDKRFPTVTRSRQRVSCLLTALAVGSSRLAAFLMPTSEVACMTNPEPQPEPLIEPTVPQVNERHYLADRAAPKTLPPRLDHHERGRIRAACSAARRIYPEPVARVLVGELMAFDEIGYRWAKPGAVSPLIDHLLQPAPVATEVA